MLFLLLFLISFLFSPPQVTGVSPDELQQQIEEYTQKIAYLSQAKDTLENQIAYLSSQISLTLLKIEQTKTSIALLESDINALGQKIDKLDVYLNHLSSLFIHQVNQDYKLQKRINPFSSLLSGNLNNLFYQQKYLSSVQKKSQQTLMDMETVRTNYDIQKTKKEQKQQQLQELERVLAQQQQDLSTQKQSKSNLLEITKNDEKRYQQLKGEAERELQALLAARLVGSQPVKKGQALGIMGNTGYSFGDHLHFGLYQLSEGQLSSWSYTNDLDPSGYIQQHRWPMEQPIIITQARGQTKYSYLYADRFHHGIDMIADNKTIITVNDGIAYFYRNPQSSLGNHVKVFHPDGFMTLYLHLQ